MPSPIRVTTGVSTLQSALWATNTGVVEGPEGVLLIDPGISPAEMQAVAEVAGGVAAGFCTHAHWDHVLWHPDFGHASPRYASTETVALISQRREKLLGNLESAEKQAGAGTLWQRDLLFKEQSLPWGAGEIAGIPVELIPVRGHEDGQAALLLPDHDVCFVADTLSDVETPSLNGGMGRLREYERTLDRLQQVIDRVRYIIPGHGSVADRAEAQRRLDLDRAYLKTLATIPYVGSVHTDTEQLALSLLQDLDEQRAGPGLSWDMHVENVQALIDEQRAGESASIDRRSARLMVLNTAGEVWMLRINDPVRPRWILPGGGVEPGETWEQAASRELWEECGIRMDVAGPQVGERRAVQSWRGNTYRANERYFVVRVGEQQPKGANMLEHESQHYTEQRWWSVDELRTTYEITYPIALADVLDAINQGETIRTPVVFPD